MRRSLITFALAIVSTSAFGFENHDYTFKVVAQTGQTISGYQMAQFSDPAINNLNNVIFEGYAAAPFGQSTFLAGLFSPESILVTLNGTCLGPFSINDAGQIVFVEDSKLTPTDAFASGIYETTYSGREVQTIAAPGAVVDGVELLGNICTNTANADGGTFAFDHSGRIAFFLNGFFKYSPARGLTQIKRSELEGKPLTQFGLVDGQSDELLFTGATASFEAIFADDRILVKTPKRIDGLEVTSIFESVASRDGKVLFLGVIGDINNDRWGLFTRDSVIAKSGQRIGDKVIETAGEPFFGLPAINNRGEVVFAATVGSGLSTDDRAIFSRDCVIVSVGDSIGGRTITALGQPALNDYGVIAFLATFSDGSQEILEATKKWR